MIAPHAVLKTFPVLRTGKSPGLAALIGFLTGGIGLALYFRSVRDLFPVEVTCALVIVGSLIAGVNPVDVASIVAPLVGGLYGFLRARSSNQRRAASTTSSVVSAAG
jgi:hypothetical protein